MKDLRFYSAWKLRMWLVALLCRLAEDTNSTVREKDRNCSWHISEQNGHWHIFTSFPWLLLLLCNANGPRWMPVCTVYVTGLREVP